MMSRGMGGRMGSVGAGAGVCGERCGVGDGRRVEQVLETF